MLLVNITKKIFKIGFFFCKNKIWEINKNKIIIKNIYKITQELGPLYIKLGQILSTRPDILSNHIIKILKKFYDKIPQFKGKLIKIKLKNNFSKNKKKYLIIKNISNKPIASASISQIYTSKLKKKKIIIKIISPFIQQHMYIDFVIIRYLLKLGKIFFYQQIKKIKLQKVFKELKTIIYKEKNLLIEAVNTTKIKKYLKKQQVIIPKILWNFTTKNILVTEFIKGIPFYKLNKIKKLNKKNIVTQYVKLFCTQVFKYNIFHADMHPGNILINNYKKSNHKLVLIDFGITGTLTRKDKLFMAYNILAFINRNYKKIAELHLPKKNRKSITKKKIENELYYTCEPITNKHLKDIPFFLTLKKFLKIATKYDINIKKQFLLFQKTLITIEGVCRSFNLQIDLRTIIKPIIEDILIKNLIHMKFQKLFKKIIK